MAVVQIHVAIRVAIDETERADLLARAQAFVDALETKIIQRGLPGEAVRFARLVSGTTDRLEESIDSEIPTRTGRA